MPTKEHTNPQWKSLADLSTAEQTDFAQREFPAAWDALDADPEQADRARRDFLKIMGASMSLAGLGACVRQPEEVIVPYVKQPEEVIPGKPRYYATTLYRRGYGFGVIAESHLGRPTHLEGNPDHPASLGGMDAATQASVLDFWDPHRSKSVMRRGKIASWGLLSDEILPLLSKLDGRGGEGLRILTQRMTSPSIAAQMDKLFAALPKAQWHQWDPLHRDEVMEGARIAFGRPLETRYNFDQAKVIVGIDADVFGELPGAVAYARQVMDKRREGKGQNRIYAVESSPTSFGVAADHRVRLRAGEMGLFLQELAEALGVPGVRATATTIDSGLMKGLVEDLVGAGPSAVVAIGDHLPAEAHALVHAIHQHLGAMGTTVEITEPVAAHVVDNRASVASLVQAMNEGDVELLVVLGGNPVYDAPAHLGFKEAYAKVPERVHVGTDYNETAYLSQWHLPMSHELEAWTDLRAYDGTVSIGQPLIAPLYDTKDLHEIMAILSGDLSSAGSSIVQSYWGEKLGSDEKLQRALHDGVAAGTRFPPLKVSVRAQAAKGRFKTPPKGLEVVLRPCPNVGAGEQANNAWLQETPRPISRIVWDNAVYVAPATAERLKVENDDLVRVTVGQKVVEGPVFVLPGTAEDSLLIHLGYGRTQGGEVLQGVGFDAYPLLMESRIASGASLEKTNHSYRLVTVQDHWTMEGRNHVRHTTVSEYGEKPAFAQAPSLKVLPVSLYPEIKYEDRAWGMAIDLSACVGCNACMVACQSENNIAVVGKEQVGNGREMHWIRIDRYYEGSAEEPTYHMQPLTCMHCERAPCEPVCPANATVHGPEGLNQMVYNRCIGTRYCSNNCPYKVRRFNFFLYSDWKTESLKGQRNPDVSVRSRGVMEKCTFCIQRIKEVTIDAEVKGIQKIKDGSIKTACQSACPTQAIAFGDINDPNSEVARLKATQLNYTVLEELNTAPRTSYLAAISNPNPKVKS